MDLPPTAHLQAAGDGSSRWSFGPARASAWLVCDQQGRCELRDRSGVLQKWPDPLQALRWMETFPLGRAAGSRWIGYLSFDLGRWFETLPCRAADDLTLPLFAFGFFSADAVATDAASQERVTPARLVSSTFTRQAWLAAVSSALQLIAAGDIFQVNLSQRFTLSTAAPPLAVWRQAMRQAPPLYGALLDFGDFALLSLSPELFLHVRGRQIVTRPIKGTRPRRPGMDVELRNSAKDAAELNMIIDLERNDLGRICEIGSVRVTQLRTIEAHPTVYHGVATVAGTLRPEVGLVEMLQAMFPGGSITGAPKIRAMQIIEQLEPVRRGPYCGAIGYLDADGSMQFNVAIRTMIFRNGLVHVPVGAGIVADSDPATEYEETLTKAAAMLAALGVSGTEDAV